MIRPLIKQPVSTRHPLAATAPRGVFHLSLATASALKSLTLAPYQVHECSGMTCRR